MTIRKTTVFDAQVRFHNGSILLINEQIKVTENRNVQRVKYVFHYQSIDSRLIFRYDNSPHYPHLATFPVHKHIVNSVIEAEPPDLADVLHEIDTIIYAGTTK